MESTQIDSPKETKIGCPRKSYLSRMNSATTDSDSILNPSGLDILANIASPKHQRVDSFSNVSLPDEMRISFSESDVSFQLDDVDFSYSPSTDVDLTNANIISLDSNSDLNGDKDLQSIQASITSTSGLELNRNNDIIPKQWTELENVKKRKKEKNSSKQLLSIGDQMRGINELNDKNLDDKPLNIDGQAPQVSTVGSSGEVTDKKLTSPRRGNKVKHQMNVACQVCGDMAAGFYCGAYICEACKKFYMRAYKLDKMKYVCLRDKNCPITKESRVQCQYCRYQKCLSLNMYFPKQGEDNHKEAVMSEIPCRVCSAPSSGFHFGAITCEGCKGFFRRMVKERDSERYQCSKKGNCEINMLTRNLCKACRYEKCLKAGMNIEASRIGRQPNSVKHMISIELKNKVKADPDKIQAGFGINQNGMDIQIKKEPEDSLDGHSVNSGSNSKTLSDQSALQNPWINLCNNDSSKNSASQTQSAQISFSTDFNTSPNQNRVYTPVEKVPNSKVTNQTSNSIPNFIPSSSGTNQFSDIIDLDLNSHQDNPRSSQVAGSVQAPEIPSLSPQSQKTQSYNKQFNHNAKSVRFDSNITVKGQNSSSKQAKFQPWNTNSDSFSGDFNIYNFDEGSDNVSNNISKNVAEFDLLSDSDDESISAQTSPTLWNPMDKCQQQIPQQQQQQHQNRQQTPPHQQQQSQPKQQQQLQQQQQQIQQTPPRQHQPQQQPSSQQNGIIYSPQDQQRFFDGNFGQSQPKKPKPSTPSLEDGFGLTRPPLFSQGGEAGDKGGGDEDEYGLNDLTMSMPEFIQNVFEAGKCLQLLNYRVFDTDLNPTASMNVDEIKNLFRSKNVDPRVGNTITSSVNMSMFATKESTWSYMMTNFHHNTYITIRFAKMVPGFKTLSLNDQVKLIQTSIYPIELLNMSKVYDPVTKWYNYFTYTKEEENIMMEQFPMLRVLQEHFLHVGEMVSTFSLTDEEFALLSALLLFPAEISGLENPKAVEDLQNRVTAALQYYEEQRSPDGLTRFGILLVRVAELIQCLLQHNLAIGLLLTRNPTIKVPQLFHELIIESIKEGQRS